MRQRTSGPYARAAFGSSIAAAMQRTAGSAVFTAAIRSAVNVAIPHRRGTAEATKAMRTTPFCGATAVSVGNATLGEGTGESATLQGRAGRVPSITYVSRDTGSPALRHAVKPPRMFATSRPAASRTLAARLERIPPAQ